MASSNFDDVRSIISESGNDSKVEVNQRALIDKILARYATPGAVYRELLQNSNDANATRCEVRINTSLKGGEKVVDQVVYRNNGMPFRTQDWNRLKKIAEGNPDSSKVGFFGVGAYAMFSICEEPMVVSGDDALVFKWKGDSLWARVGKSKQKVTEWTSFVLPARDPYPTPDLVEFGSFIFGNLTFLNSIKSVSVFIDESQELLVERSVLTAPKTVRPPKSTSWWVNNGAILRSPNGYFRLQDTDGSITETTIGLKAKLGSEMAEAKTRLLSAVACVNITTEMKRRIERVTKKYPPETVTLKIVIGDTDSDPKLGLTKRNVDVKAKTIVDSFSPGMGNGRIFIGFKTSQSTGLGVHFSAPLIPTVEREAIDLVDPTLKKYNSELLFTGGILMRLGLEHVMLSVDKLWKEEAVERKTLDEKEIDESYQKRSNGNTNSASSSVNSSIAAEPNADGALSGFSRFMASGFRRITDIATNSETSDTESLLNTKEKRPLSKAETTATVLMRSFSPEQSTPEYLVGQFLASGFESTMPSAHSPVLTRSGVMRGHDAFLPNLGMEAFVKDSVIRSTVLKNARTYLEHVARVPRLSLNNLSKALKSKVISDEDVVRLLQWWALYSKKYVHPSQMKEHSDLLKGSINFELKDSRRQPEGKNIYAMKTFIHFSGERHIPLTLPLPKSVIPLKILHDTPSHVFEDESLRFWFQPLTFLEWIQFIAKSPCMNDFVHHEQLNLVCLQFIHREFLKYRRENLSRISQWMKALFSEIPCLPYDNPDQSNLLCPKDLYLPSAEIEVFFGVDLRKVSSNLLQNGISENLMKSMGVRETVSMDILFTQLDSLKWNENPLPLIKFLRQSKLKESDFQKLRTNRYLPAAGIQDQLFAPSDLCLPRKQLLELGFARVLQWPEDSDAREHTPDGKFLILLGCKIAPPLAVIIRKVSSLPLETDKELRDKILDYLLENTSRRGIYGNEMGSVGKFGKVPFLPTTSYHDVLLRDTEVQSQSTFQDCFYDEQSKILGFKIVEARHKALAQRFGVSDHPNWELLSKFVSDYAASSRKLSPNGVVQYFLTVFHYLSTRCSTMPGNVRLKLQNDTIIPIKQSDGRVVWRTSHQVFFKKISLGRGNEYSDAISGLFDFVPEISFLRHIGVKDEPGAEEICKLISKDPISVFEKCGQSSYKRLLKRVGANFSQISRESINDLKNSKCLLAFRFVEENETKSQNNSSVDDELQNVVSSLENPNSVCVIDDAFMQRMFNPPICPIESDMEELYLSLGSKYISQVVTKYHEISGNMRKETKSTIMLQKILVERIPLLIAPNVTHRPLLPKATSLLQPKNIDIVEVDKVSAIYVLGSNRKTHNITCCSSKTLKTKTSNITLPITLLIRSDIDFFDVGSTICDIILSRSHLEDKFLFGTLLEAPLSQLRNRGFPVDRIIKVKEESNPKSEEPTEQHISLESKNILKNNLKSKEKTSEEGYLEILSNKFPDCSPEHIKSLLAADKSSNKLLNVSRILEKGKYPTRDGRTSRSGSWSSFARQSVSRQSRPLSRMREAFSKIGSNPTNETQRKQPNYQKVRTNVQDETENRKNLESLIQNSINSTSRVTANGVNTPSQTRHIEKGEDHECVEGKNLVPAPGPTGRNRTSHGILVFGSKEDDESLNFVKNSVNWRYIERFSVLLHQISQIFSVDPSSIAVFYDISGTSIAFNLSGALYFNVRYFIKLHFKDERNLHSEAYSYWFVVFCHELAHNLIKNHGREHGHYTEAFCQQYQTGLFELLKELQL